MAERVTHTERSLFDFGPLVQDYDRWYETPIGQSYDHVQKQDVRHLLRPAKPHERLMDVGCGTGHWSSFFASMGYRVTGIDISPKMIGMARAAVPECGFEIADACNLPFEDMSFDVVDSMATLEFISDPAAAISEMARCTKSGGSLLIGTLNRDAPLNRHRLSEGCQPYSSAHLLIPKELIELLQPYGKVRMVASPVVHREKRSLSGAFIVAEVRT